MVLSYFGRQKASPIKNKHMMFFDTKFGPGVLNVKK